MQHFNEHILTYLHQLYPLETSFVKLPRDFHAIVYDQALKATIIFMAQRYKKNGKPNQVRISQVMGINRNTLRKYIQRLGINLNDYHSY